MPNYRRDLTPGGTWFFTVCLRDRTSDLLVRHIQALRIAVRDCRQKAPFDILAWVVLPEHMHAIWALPPGDADYPSRWRMIKTRFSRRLPVSLPTTGSARRRGEKGIWQRRYWEHCIRDERDLHAHLDYLHFNPVKHGLCNRVVEWPHSTFHRWVENGHYSADWGVGMPAFDGEFGE
jgi:putative transposase